MNFWREVHKEHGYREIMTPLILREDLWHQSGHWDHYKDHMYLSRIGEQGYAVKPMNCPGGILLYKETQHSYREFPLRIAELGRVHRRELTGVLQGLFRVQSFVIDDAHIYCLPEQVTEEIARVTHLILDLYRAFGFEEVQIEVSTRPESYIGSDEDWETATQNLKEALDQCRVEYQVNEGEGAFYGPKIDFHIRDCLKRSWQCGTIQVDFSMPERFDLYYVGRDGNKHRPVMIHRAVYGSVERFMAILLEHYGGSLPLWLAPVQARIITVAERHNGFAETLGSEMEREGLRIEVDSRNETVGSKIRDAELLKIPFMLVVGDREVESGELVVRRYGKGKQFKITLPDLIAEMKTEVENKSKGGGEHSEGSQS